MEKCCDQGLPVRTLLNLRAVRGLAGKKKAFDEFAIAAHG